MKKSDLLFAMFMIAMLFMACSEENVGDLTDGSTGEELKSATYATFNFQLSNGMQTRAMGDFDSSPQVENQANEKKIGTGDLYILVFNAVTKALEYKSDITSSSHTALLTAGQKKIFVLANISNVNPKLVKLDVTNPFSAVPAAFPYSSLTVGSSTLDDLSKIVFNAGTPQPYNVDKTTLANGFSISPLYTLINPGTLGLPMSNSNANTFTLNANVTEVQANTPTSAPAANGSETYNRFKVELDYMGAKARLVMNPTAFVQTTADISSPVYSVKNLAKYTNLVQNVVAGVPQSAYHAFVVSTVPAVAYKDHFDQAANVKVSVVGTAVAATPYLYVPENTNATLLRGQSSFYALNVVYKPKKIVKNAVFNPLTDKVDFTYDTYDNMVAADALQKSGADHQYIYATAALGGIDPTVIFFASLRQFADAVWMSVNKKPLTDASYVVADADALVIGNFKTYTNAGSWYRLDIGEGTGTSATYGVWRGNAYTATVTNITGPGEPTEGGLFDNPEDPVSARTYINVTIEAKNWTPKSQQSDL